VELFLALDQGHNLIPEELVHACLSDLSSLLIVTPSNDLSMMATEPIDSSVLKQKPADADKLRVATSDLLLSYRTATDEGNRSRTTLPSTMEDSAREIKR
jgi:hypothetical protein